MSVSTVISSPGLKAHEFIIFRRSTEFLFIDSLPEKEGARFILFRMSTERTYYFAGSAIATDVYTGCDPVFTVFILGWRVFPVFIHSWG